MFSHTCSPGYQPPVRHQRTLTLTLPLLALMGSAGCEFTGRAGGPCGPEDSPDFITCMLLTVALTMVMARMIC